MNMIKNINKNLLFKFLIFVKALKIKPAKIEQAFIKAMQNRNFYKTSHDFKA